MGVRLTWRRRASRRNRSWCLEWVRRSSLHLPGKSILETVFSTTKQIQLVNDYILTADDAREEVATPDGNWLNTGWPDWFWQAASFSGNVLFRQYCWSSGELFSCIDVLPALANDSSDGSSLIDSPAMGMAVSFADAAVWLTRMLRPSSGSKRNNRESLRSGTVSTFEPCASRKSKSDDWKTTTHKNLTRARGD